MRTLVESDMRFEHCYRVDEEVDTRTELKRACWADWNNRYAKGQEQYRVTYAKDRISALSQGSDTSYKGGKVAAPDPTSPYAPPPATRAPVIVALAPSVSAAPKKTFESCADDCSNDFRACLTSCDGKPDCIGRCDDPSFKTCMKACRTLNTP